MSSKRKLKNKDIISKVVDLVEKKLLKLEIQTNDPIDKLKDIIKKHSKLEIDLSSENIDKKVCQCQKSIQT